MNERTLVRADLVTGVVLVALGLAVIAESLAMPRFELRRINPWTVPGLVPGLVGVVLAVLGAVLALRSALDPGLRPPTATGEADADRGAALLRLAGCLGLCLVYAIWMVGALPFWLATGVFVFAFIVIFEWRPGDGWRRRAGKLGAALLVAIGAALAITLLFERLFLVRLP